jgi:hypothetical protein
VERIGPTVQRILRRLARRRYRTAEGEIDLELLMDWTGTRMRITDSGDGDKVGELTLTPQIAGPYTREEAGVVEFVQRYARATMIRLSLDRVVVRDPDGKVLAEVLPEPSKAPF